MGGVDEEHYTTQHTTFDTYDVCVCRALHRAMEATRFMGGADEEQSGASRGGMMMEGNDEVDRLTLRASLWMAVRVQVSVLYNI